MESCTAVRRLLILSGLRDLGTLLVRGNMSRNRELGRLGSATVRRLGSLAGGGDMRGLSGLGGRAGSLPGGWVGKGAERFVLLVIFPFFVALASLGCGWGLQFSVL